MISIDLGESCIEQLWIKCKVNHTTFAISVFYRPPIANIHTSLDQFDSALSLILPSVDYVICMGDVNVNLLNLDNPVSQCFSCFGFTQIIDEPTRVTGTSSTLIDPIFVSTSNIVINAGVVNADEISDHKLTFCELSFKVEKFKPKFITFRDYKNFDYHNFYNDLIETPWNNVLYEHNIEKKISLFELLIKNLFNIHAPIRTVRVSKPKSPWLTDTITIMRKERDRALRKYKISKSEDDFRSYKTLRNLTLSSIRREKKAYIDSVFNDNNPRKTWTTLRDLNVKFDDTVSIPEHLKDVDTINNYFASVFCKENCDELVDYYTSSIPKSNNFRFKLATVEKIHQILFQIKSNASGSDNISLSMLTYCSPYLDPYITHIVNVCLENNYFPEAWKTSVIHPLPKTKSPESYADLRPISLLPILSKILEKVIYEQLIMYCNENHILPITQSGFRKSHSTATALSNIIDHLVKDLDEQKISVLVLLDFSKAFDTINHNLLCAKLKYYGLSSGSVEFMHSYLAGRYQRVIIGDKASSLLPVTSGVPQGSILGPLLFTIYTADLLGRIQYCSYQAYADDTKLQYSFAPYEYHIAEYRLNCDLNTISSVAEQHNLKLNGKKSSVIYFGGHKAKHLENHMRLLVNNSRIEVHNVVKSLGVLIDSKLKFSDQVNKQIQKAFINLRLMYANRAILNKKLKIMLSESLVLSHFNYCNFVYGPFLDIKDKSRIQKMQNSCCRFIFGLRKYDHISAKIRELNWLNMPNRQKLNFATFVHKIMITASPSYLKDKLVSRHQMHNIPTRFSNLLAIPKHSTALYCKCFTYQAIKLYNSIPPDFKNYNISSFKAHYKEKLLKEQ